MPTLRLAFSGSSLPRAILTKTQQPRTYVFRNSMNMGLDEGRTGKGYLRRLQTLPGKGNAPVEKVKSSELFHGCLAILPQDPKSLFVKKAVREDLAEMTKDKQEIERIAASCQVTELLDSHPYLDDFDLGIGIRLHAFPWEPAVGPDGFLNFPALAIGTVSL